MFNKKIVNLFKKKTQTIQEPFNLIKFLKEIGIAVIIVLIIRSFIVQLSLVPSGSMKPNLLEGDFVLVTKYNYGYSKYSLPNNLPIFSSRIFYNTPKSGDIVVFKNPNNLNEEYVKRLIGLPGDKIEVINSNIYINGIPLPKKFIKTIVNMNTKYNVYEEQLGDNNHLIWELSTPYDYYRVQDFFIINNFGPIVIPNDYFFVLGDNRHNSQDSRFIGLIHKDLLVGRPKIVLLSIGYAPITKFWNWVLEIKVNRFFKVLQ